MHCDWNQWDESVHNHWEQVKRRLTGEKIRPSKVIVDQENGAAKIVGSEGIPYNVTLLNCDCIDFSRRKRPCKHMYRLAMELDVLAPWPETDAPETLRDTISHEITRWETAFLDGHITPEKYAKVLEVLSKD